MAAPALRPLGIGEILDVAIKIYRRNARTLFLIVAVVMVPTAILSSLVEVSALPASLRLRVLREAVRRARGDLKRLTFEHVEML